MSYTGTEVFNMAVAIIDELSDTGTVNESQIKEYKYRSPYLLDLWQHENTGLQKTVRAVQKPMVNLLGERFDVLAHEADDIAYESSGTAGCAAFSVDSQAAVYIEHLVSGAWVSAEGYYTRDGGEEAAFTGLITVPELTAPAAYKCRLTNGGERTRIRFSGDYYYLYCNFALFRSAVPSCGRVPDYAPYVAYPMPEDFDRITQIVAEYPAAGLYHKWENNKDLMLRWDYAGMVKITYRPNPVKVTALTQALEISESQAAAGAYYLAMHFALSDQNSELAGVCRTKYRELKAATEVKRPMAANTISDVYGISGIR